jgi:hypothetical protein
MAVIEVQALRCLGELIPSGSKGLGNKFIPMSGGLLHPSCVIQDYLDFKDVIMESNI